MIVLQDENSLYDEPCSNELGNCGNASTAVIFFVSFVFIGNCLIINICIAVVLDTYTDSAHMRDLGEYIETFGCESQEPS